MIGMLTGNIKDLGKGTIVVETSGGIGYLVHTSEETKNGIVGKEATLYIHTTVKKDTLELFGFIDNETYSAFMLLLQVNGVGPKKALQILGTVPTTSLLPAIAHEDVESLVAYGINKKQALKIILDIGKKIGAHEEDRKSTSDIILALTGLGYTKKEISEVIKNIPTDIPIEKQIQSALRFIQSKKK